MTGGRVAHQKIASRVAYPFSEKGGPLSLSHRALRPAKGLSVP